MNCVQKHTETEPLMDEIKQITGGDDTTASSVTVGNPHDLYYYINIV